MRAGLWALLLIVVVGAVAVSAVNPQMAWGVMTSLVTSLKSPGSPPVSEPKPNAETSASAARRPKLQPEAALGEPCATEVSKGVSAWQAAVSQTPDLKIENGGHIGSIRSLSLAGGLIVSGSWDKTVRIWGAEPSSGHNKTTLQLFDTLRTPMGTDKIGQVTAVALSPDTTKIAVAGVMAPLTAPGNERVLIYNRISGQIDYALPIGQRVFALAFSDDGELLAAGAGAQAGLCVWRTSDWKLDRHDGAYEGDIGGLDIDASGRIVTTAKDGRIRLYAKDSAKPEVATLESNDLVLGNPSRVAFSPNGRLVAVGYKDSAVVTVHDAMRPGLFAVVRARRDPAEQVFSAVAWAKNGRFLYSGGTSRAAINGVSAAFVRQWRIAETSAVADVAATNPGYRDMDISGVAGSVQALNPFGDAGMIAATSDGAIAALDASGAIVHAHMPTQPNWNVYAGPNKSTLRISDDGASVFLRRADGKTLSFDIRSRAMGRDLAPELDLKPVLTEAAGLRVNADDPRAPTIIKSSQPATDLVLDPDEYLGSYALDAGGARILAGGSFALRIVNATGEELGSVRLPDAARQVAITRDGAIAVAALGDGTIRWYAIRKNEAGEGLTISEALALYAPQEGQKWILWTPTGYFDAAADADTLIGWTVNRGPARAALHYSTGRFQQLYRRPEIIDKALTAAKPLPAPSPQRVLAAAPPVVRIVSIGQTPELKLRVAYQLQWPLETAEDHVQVLGSLSEGPQFRGGRGFAANARDDVLELDVAPGDSDPLLRLVAQSSDHELSDPVIFQTNGLKPTPGQGGEPGGLNVLLIGVSKYKDAGIAQLDFADADAQALAVKMNLQKGGIYRDVNVTSLSNADATKDKILAAMQALPNAKGAHDTTVVFLAGHGTLQDKNVMVNGLPGVERKFYFLPHDATLDGDQVKPASAISEDEIADAFLGRIDGNKVLFLDACRSGQWGAQYGTSIAQSLKSKSLRLIMYAASTDRQLALESTEYRGGHGAFTAALLEALDGDQRFPRYKPAEFTPRELAVWFDRRVPELTAGKQTPVPFDASDAAYPLARVLK